MRTRYRAIFPDVYVPAAKQRTLVQQATAAWLWSGRQGVIAGTLHAAKWMPDDEPVEMVWRNARPPSGILTRRDRLSETEIEHRGGLLLTTPERTAIDPAAVLVLAGRHAGSPGVPRLPRVLDQHDPGAESPRETWLRLILIGAGYPSNDIIRAEFIADRR